MVVVVVVTVIIIIIIIITLSTFTQINLKQHLRLAGQNVTKSTCVRQWQVTTDT